MNNNEIIISESNKKAFVKLLNKDSFDSIEWLYFTADLYSFLNKKIDYIDFINDYGIPFENLYKYVSKRFDEKERKFLKSIKEEYTALQKAFDEESYLRMHSIIVDGKVVKPTIEDVEEAKEYVSEAGLPLINGNVCPAVKGILRSELFSDDPIDERRELLKESANKKMDVKQFKKIKGRYH